MKFRLSALALFLCGGMSFGAEAVPGADIFATNAPVLRILIEIPREGMRSLQHEPRKDVPATLREGNVTYQNVMVHVKGAAGSFREINQNPALTVSFGKKDPKQRFHGLRKIHLNNSVQDQSYSTENIVGGMFRDAGVPTPRATNARFTLNGKDLGFYVVKEGFTKEFLGMYFKETKGNLYDGGFLKDIDQTLEKDGGDDSKGQPDLNALLAAARVEDRAKRWEALQKVLDVDRYLTFMAIENLAWDWDGYMANRNNYRIYHDPTTDKLVFLPHGLDQMFWDSNGSIYQPQIRGQMAIVTRAVWETPEGSRLYRERVKDIFGKYYQLAVLTNRFDYLVKRNREAVTEMGRGALRDFDGNTGAVRQRIISRWQSVKDQIENEPAPVRFDQGPVLVKSWRQQNEMGDARLERTQIDGKQCLHITAGSQSSASWRSNLTLEPGRYRFEAMARTAKLSARRDEKGEGAGIRISGNTDPRRNRLAGDTGWTKLEFAFESGGGDVVLVCESRANRGEVWFDLNSLKVDRLK